MMIYAGIIFHSRVFLYPLLLIAVYIPRVIAAIVLWKSSYVLKARRIYYFFRLFAGIANFLILSMSFILKMETLNSDTKVYYISIYLVSLIIVESLDIQSIISAKKFVKLSKIDTVNAGVTPNRESVDR